MHNKKVRYTVVVKGEKVLNCYTFVRITFCSNFFTGHFFNGFEINMEILFFWHPYRNYWGKVFLLAFPTRYAFLCNMYRYLLYCICCPIYCLYQVYTVLRTLYAFLCVLCMLSYLLFILSCVLYMRSCIYSIYTVCCPIYCLYCPAYSICFHVYCISHTYLHSL